MQTSYDLVFQAQTPGQPLEVAPVQQALLARGGSTRPDGAVVWRLPGGEVVTWPLKEAGVITGLELKVPFTENPALLTQVLAGACEVAQALSLRLVDPQLSRPVVEADSARVLSEYARIAQYAGQYFGLGDAVGGAPAFKPGEEGLSPWVKGLLALAVFSVAMFAAYQYFLPTE